MYNTARTFLHPNRPQGTFFSEWELCFCFGIFQYTDAVLFQHIVIAHKPPSQILLLADNRPHFAPHASSHIVK